ncbi:hypothetical protein YK48G_15210 [Lentilactobacillus fungorum]|uniref:NAD(P)-binding domain-containing protein n=1 Tax=Lentilactobacillus fungorum TaxID=2201250 RepID=A0ABQ3W1B8_9LACO|nr:NAD(P)H-binding protein [Lentilactobacillus fungorum]GHP14096.1 hypothetical protein YK48G_15210 [Lentilactobacillus fungorum]
MKKLLCLNENHPVVAALHQRLIDDTTIHLQELTSNFQDSSAYVKVLPAVNWILAALGPNDVDLDFEALFAGIDEVQPPISHFVMLSYAGIDDELNQQPVYPGVKDFKEFIKQQRYAVKIVDEAEIPYSVIRLPRVVTQVSANYRLFNEGQKMPNGHISANIVARLVLKAFKDNQFVNQSIGVING